MDFRHKLIIPAANLITGMCGAYLSMYQISLLYIADEFALSGFMMGVIVAAQSAGICLPPLFIGTLSERIGKRGVLMISMPMMILGMLIVSVSGEIALFIAGVVLIGAGFSVTEGSMTAMLATEFSASSTFHLGTAQASFSLGAVLSPLLCESLFASGFKYNALFGMMAAVFAVLMAIIMITKQKNDIKGNSEAGMLHTLKFFRNRVFVYIAVAMVMYVGAESVIAFFIDSYFELTLGAPQLSALALSLFWAGMIPTRLLLGAIKLKHKTTIIGCAAGILLCIFAIALAPSQTVRLAAYAGLGVFCGPCWPLIMDIVAKKYPKNAGAASSLMVSLGGLGSTVMPVVAGAVIAGADFTPVLVIAGACAAIMAAMFYLTSGRTNSSEYNT